LNDLPGISCLAGWGTFYAFANVEQAMRMIGAADDDAFAEFLINEAGVAVVPGSGFGAPGHFRLSFACSTEMLKDALGRMQRALAGAVARKRA
jgi:aspartate aminotransferase